jgi:hypothetical protein
LSTELKVKSKKPGWRSKFAGKTVLGTRLIRLKA